MRRGLAVGCVLAALVLARAAGSEDKHPGAPTFRTYCAPCHGADGKGEGPRADSLRYHPADLSQIAARNGGSFPFEKVVRIVDGRVPVKGHGAPDMPVWGDAFKNADARYDDKRVREKIREVVDYLRTLQAR